MIINAWRQSISSATTWKVRGRGSSTIARELPDPYDVIKLYSPDIKELREQLNIKGCKYKYTLENVYGHSGQYIFANCLTVMHLREKSAFLEQRLLHELRHCPYKYTYYSRFHAEIASVDVVHTFVKYASIHVFTRNMRLVTGWFWLPPGAHINKSGRAMYVCLGRIYGNFHR